MEPMQWRTSGRRLLAAAAAAVAIHLLLALGLSLWPSAPPATLPRREAPLSVTLRERSAVPGTNAPASAPAERSAPATVPRPPRTRSAPATALAQGPEGENPAAVPSRPSSHGPLAKEEVAGEGLAHQPG